VTDITERLAQIVERVARAATRSGRDPSDVTIVAVSKGQPAAAIAAAHAAGVRHFGENYVQEAVPKMDRVAELPITWHFIGKLQANKTRLVAERFAWVHTVDRARIAERLNEQRPPHAEPLNVLIQVNQGNQGAEPHRGGAAPNEVAALAKIIAALPRLHLRGLMTLPPQHDSPKRWFAELATLSARLRADGIALDALSMGMSADFEAAIAAGATFVRIGTAIFGSRGA
jgi:pyridoxal phosphate enzyme (YggS family)